MELKRLIKERWDSSAAQYGDYVRDELRNDKEKWRRYINRHIEIKPGIKILDIGCGPGFMNIVISGENYETIGIDQSENMLAEAARNVRVQRANVELLNMDVHDPQFDEDTFDIIICRNIVWTLFNPGMAYKRWHRILKPGGRMLIFDSSWNREFHDIEELNAKKIARQNNGLPDDYEYFGDPTLAVELDTRLPLGKKSRPDWDVYMLEKMGFDTEVFSDAWQEVCNEQYMKEYEHAPMFMIEATKRIKKKRERGTN